MSEHPGYKEYLLAKAKLCGDLAIKQAEEGDIGSALANLLRMNNAMEIIGLKEESKVWTRK